MRLTVFGGTRGTGLHLIQKATGEGYDLTALARRPEILRDRFRGILIISGDVFNLESVSAAVKGSDAVISTIGRVGQQVFSHASETNLYSEGVLNIARVMQTFGTRRLIALAGLGINPNPDLPWHRTLLMNLVVPLVAANPESNVFTEEERKMFAPLMKEQTDEALDKLVGSIYSNFQEMFFWMERWCLPPKASENP